MAVCNASFGYFTRSPSRVSEIGFSSRTSPFECSEISVACGDFVESRMSFSGKMKTLQASFHSYNAFGLIPLFSFMDSDENAGPVPMPIVLIDQYSNPNATLVHLHFGDQLGALIDTMKALKDLGLNVMKGTVTTVGPVLQIKILVTCLDTGKKVKDPDMLERIKLTVIHNLLRHHPESSVQLAMDDVFGTKPPEQLDIDISTHICIVDDGARRSVVYIETADRPGLLLGIFKIMAGININVESAEIETKVLPALLFSNA